MRIIATINQIDRIYTMYRHGEIPWLIAVESFAALGAYRIDAKGVTIDGLRVSFCK